jgi:cytidylate kinase
VHARDVRDSTRESAPLELSKDAFTIDTTHLTEEQAFEKAQNYMASENFNRQRI